MTMALERNTMFKNNLVLPTVYQKIDTDEMEYLDGGVSTVTAWWGFGINLNGAETALFLSNYGYALGVMIAIAGFGGPVAALAVAVIYGAYGALINSYNSNNSGVKIMYTWANLIIPGGTSFPIIFDNY